MAFKRGTEQRIRRFVADGRSMEPGIADGDGLIGVRSPRVRAGQVRVFAHPYRPGSWLVKRVERVEGDRMWVLSDNAEVTRADSREFGSLPVAGSYRVVLRVPRRLLGVTARN